LLSPEGQRSEASEDAKKKNNALSETVERLTERYFHCRLWDTGYHWGGLSDISFSHHYAWTLGRRL